MTTPTPAQIEAFRQAMPSWWHRGYAQKKEETEEIVRCLTAAAEVEDKDVKAATIELCARVADDYRNYRIQRTNDSADYPARVAEEIAAAIRAKKNKP